MTVVSGQRSRAFLGIDAGGTATRALGTAGGKVVHSGEGGPGNPLAVSSPELLKSYAAALAGCPEPAVVAACVAGAGSAAGRARIEVVLQQFFPRALISVRPDYVAAFMAARAGTQTLVVAGTGSIICSRLSADGSYRVSGGRGWIVGDHGSAARLGRAYLDWYCRSDDPPPTAAPCAEAAFGSREPASIVAQLHTSAAPAAFLASGAPLLTAAAERGETWAQTLLTGEMEVLAEATATHLANWVPGDRPVRLGLSGGVWTSPLATSEFGRAIAVYVAPRTVDLALGELTPVQGALRLASELAGAT